MGRKSKNKKTNQPNGGSSSSDANKQLSKSVKKEIMDNVKTLLDRCSKQAVTGPKEFEEYLEIRELVEKIISLQKDISLKLECRDGKLPKFFEWLKTNNVDTSCVDIEQFKGFGHGLKATKDLKEGELFLTIPRDIMMTPASAKTTSLGPYMAEDKILQVMPSVVLALHLLCEKRSPESKWQPYIDVLPEAYFTPLYLSPDDIKQLKGSPAFSDCISQYRNIARQYAYFYRLFHTDISSTNFPLKEYFTYEDYRWAVSTVMTRQNQIPTEDGGRMTFALIPLWDMCNHCNGLITTDFNIEKSCSECYALNSYKTNDQIFIFYGARSNAELLVNNGFVYPENAHDRLALKLGISKGDPLFNLKSEILTKCGLLAARTFYLHTGDVPIDTDLLIFLRIFSMDEESLKTKYSEASCADIREELGDIDRCVSEEVDLKVWTYLETRVTLLLKTYDTTLEEDEALLKKGKLSEIVQLIVQLRCCEKRILQTTVTYAAERKEKVHLVSEQT